MLSKSLLTWAVLAAPLCNANPIVSPPAVHVERINSDLALREAMNVAARDASLQKRLDTSVDLAKSLDDYTIFKGSWIESIDGISNNVSAKVTCVECYTTGTVSASILDDLLSPKLRLDFEGVEAYVDLEVAVSDTATYTYTIFSTDTPVGLSAGDVSIGLVFYVDIVLSLSAEVDLEGGFAVQVANGSYIEADIFTGDISSSLFTGTTVQAVPITIISGEATLKADLRLRVEAGASADALGVGVNAELGIYANILEFIVEAETTAACDLLLLETWDINAGAFLDADVVVDYSTFGAVPTVSTTLYQGPTATQCLGAVGSTATATAAATSSQTVAHDVVVGAELGSSVASSASNAVSVSGSTGLAHLFTNATASASASASATASATASTIIDATAAAGSNGTTLTSTIFATSTYTITSCAASVVNCPATLQNKIVVTEIVTSTVAICPEASTTITLPASSTANTKPVSKPTTTTASAASAANGTLAVVTDVYVLVPCKTPVVATFTAPTSVASVSIAVLGAVKPSSSASALASASAAIEKETATVAPVLSATGGAFYGNSSSAKAVLAVGQVGSTAVLLPTGSVASAGVSAAVSSPTIVKLAAASASSSGAASPSSTSAQSAVTAAAGRVVSGTFATVFAAVIGTLILL